MKTSLCIVILFLLLLTSILLASNPLSVYVNNKPYQGKIYNYNGMIYVEASAFLTFIKVAHTSTDTTLNLKDSGLQEKLYKIAVWVDYKDGRGNVISFPLKSLAEVMGGHYAYYPDTNTVDMVSFARKTDPTPQPQASNSTTKPSGNTTSVSSGENVNPLNTSTILNKAHDAVNSINVGP